tara:strand:+ start:1337 stop:2155 length:819 start_codon:yes stop_codon:yes gene_type:complete
MSETNWRDIEERQAIPSSMIMFERRDLLAEVGMEVVNELGLRDIFGPAIEKAGKDPEKFSSYYGSKEKGDLFRKKILDWYQTYYNEHGEFPDYDAIKPALIKIYTGEFFPYKKGGRRTRGKLRAKSRAKSRKKRRKSRRKKSGGMIREIQLNEVKIGARYGVRVRLPRRGEDYFRGNLISVERNTNPHIRPLVGEDKMYTFDKVQGNGLYSEVELPERWIIKITEYDIPNLNDTDANINVNEFLGGRRKRTRKKRRKSRRKKRRKSRRKRKR